MFGVRKPASTIKIVDDYCLGAISEVNCLNVLKFLKFLKFLKGATLVQDLDYLLAKSDFVSLHPELTNETYEMFALEAFQKMKPTAFLINTSCGKIIRERDLVTAIREKLIVGAAIDVFEPEPSSIDNPLYGFDNVIFSPHLAGVTPEAGMAAAISAANQILQVLQGEKPPYIINPEVWNM